MIVVDASVAVKWFFPEPGREMARTLLEGGARLFAPTLIVSEVAGALVKRARLGGASREEVLAHLADWLAAISAGAIVVSPVEQDLPRAAQIALDLSHPLFDCVYLALAQRHGFPLITADAAFCARALPMFPEMKLLGT